MDDRIEPEAATPWSSLARRQADGLKARLRALARLRGGSPKDASAPALAPAS